MFHRLAGSCFNKLYEQVCKWQILTEFLQLDEIDKFIRNSSQLTTCNKSVCGVFGCVEILWKSYFPRLKLRLSDGYSYPPHFPCFAQRFFYAAEMNYLLDRRFIHRTYPLETFSTFQKPAPCRITRMCFLTHTDNKEVALKETRSCFALVNDAITESEEVLYIPYTTVWYFFFFLYFFGI